MPLNRTATNQMTLSKLTLGIIILNITTKFAHIQNYYTQHNDNQRNKTQHHDGQHTGVKFNFTQPNNI